MGGYSLLWLGFWDGDKMEFRASHGRHCYQTTTYPEGGGQYCLSLEVLDVMGYSDFRYTQRHFGR
jgi:hypothetical protein